MKISKTFCYMINFWNNQERVDSFEEGIQKLKDNCCRYNSVQEVEKIIDLDTFTTTVKLVRYADLFYDKVRIKEV